VADISYSVSDRVSKDFLNAQVASSNITANMSLTGLQSQTLTLSTNAVSISTANLGSVGLAFMQNLSTATASTCQVGIEAGGSFVGFATLRAGEPAIVRLTTGVDYKATGVSGTRLRVDIMEG
jgi:hypothetical protein